MKSRLLVFLFFIAFLSKATGQNNPIENLAWSQWYEYPNNFFELTWDEPAQPHNKLVGYNIYRDNELYRFQTDNSLYNIYSPVYGFVWNCDIDFLAVNNQNEPYVDGFEVHVTAVYNPGLVESGFLQTYFVTGPALATNNYIQKKVELFPNPTNGLLNIGNSDYEKIIIYDMSGKFIKEFAAHSQIDLVNLSKGIYIIKIFSLNEVMVGRVVIN